MTSLTVKALLFSDLAPRSEHRNVFKVLHELGFSPLGLLLLILPVHALLSSHLNAGYLHGRLRFSGLSQPSRDVDV